MPIRVKTIDSKRNRQGMILVFVIVVMMLTSLMGLIIMVSARSEAVNAGQHRQNQAAFISADSAAKLTILLCRQLLHPELYESADIVTTPPSGLLWPITVTRNPTRFTEEKLIEESEIFKYLDRYVETGLTNDPTANEPHLTFKSGEKVLATVAITLDSVTEPSEGCSLQNGPGDQGKCLPVDMVVTIKGNTAQGANETLGPQSVITLIMQELM
ncbi:MAG: hypothetical protein LBT38_10975 [Deltaproteobacteria bacterium]|jgi:hypothetical protein|nr:hypothetical protein [Deltaproteobacteria bacterium]